MDFRPQSRYHLHTWSLGKGPGSKGWPDVLKGCRAIQAEFCLGLGVSGLGSRKGFAIGA